MQNLYNFLNTNIYALSVYARLVANTLVVFVIARYISVWEYGLFSNYKALCYFILVLACLGFSDYILVSSQNNLNEVKKKISLFMINAFLIIFISSVIAYFLHIKLYIIFVLVLMKMFFDITFFSLILPFFQAGKKIMVLSNINFLYSFILIFITIISYMYKLSLMKFLILSCTLGSVAFVLCSVYAGLNYIKPITSLKNTFKICVDKSIFKYMIGTVLNLLYSQIPSLYIVFFQTEEISAIYFSAFAISNALYLYPSSLNQKIMPELINATVQKVKQILAYNIKLTLIINIIIFIVFCFTGKLVLHTLYGKEYYCNGYIPLLILTLANICLTIGILCDAYIVASENQSIKIKIQAESIVVSLLALLILHKYGIYAALYSWLLSGLYSSIRYITKVNELLQIKSKRNII